MDTFEVETHSFIIKIWLEEDAGKGSQPAWRGHITHVPGGQRRYLKDLDEIAECIAPYLREMGVQPDLHERAQQWLDGLKRRFSDKDPEPPPHPEPGGL